MSGDIMERLRRIHGGSAVVEVTQEAADEIERLRAEVVRVEGQRKLRADLAYLMKSEKDDALAEIVRLRAAGDALAEVVDDWPELVAAWQKARREQ